MKKTNQTNDYSIRGSVKTAPSHNGGTKGHSKPSSGTTHAGPPPAPQPTKK